MLKIVMLFILSSLVCAQDFPAGKMNIVEDWAVNETGGDVLKAFIQFTPSKNAPSCERLSFIQIARVQLSETEDYVWTENEGLHLRNEVKTTEAPGIEQGFFIDINTSKCKQGSSCSPFYRDSWPNPDESSDGVSTDSLKQTASMLDAPYGWERFEQIKLEACAICQNGNSLMPLACVKWGGKWSLISDREILPVLYSESPSATFNESLRLFQDFFQNHKE